MGKCSVKCIVEMRFLSRIGKLSLFFLWRRSEVFPPFVGFIFFFWGRSKVFPPFVGFISCSPYGVLSKSGFFRPFLV